jgi:hypothetical protein
VAKPRNPIREIAYSLGAALVLGGAFAAYLLHTVPSAEQLKSEMSLLAPSARHEGPGLHERVSLVADQFVQNLRRGNFDAALALTAKPYRESASIENFTSLCKASPYLATVKEIRFFRVSQQSVPLADGTTATGPATATGLLIAESGNVDVVVSFAPEGREFRILTILVAGVPILQAVSAETAPAASTSAARVSQRAPSRPATRSAKAP